MEPRVRDGNMLLHELSERLGRPLGVHLQVADRCNHTCVHCYQVQGLKGELSLDDLKSVLRELAAAGILELNVSGGEATLRADLPEILAYATTLGFAIRLYTNAFSMTPALAQAIARARILEVHVSVYSDRAAEHDAVTKVSGSWTRTVAGIEMLRSRGLRVVMKTPALHEASGATQRIAGLAERLGCALLTSTEITPREDGAIEPTRHALSGADQVALGLAEGWTPETEERLTDAVLGEATCGVCTSSVTVLPNGDVLPCTDTPVVLGNVRETPLSTMMTQDSDTALFKSLTWRSVHGCRDCDLVRACNRCHAAALLGDGDYLGPYLAACDRARARYAAGVAGEFQLLEPADDCDPGRSPTLGPYRIEQPGRLRPIPDRVTAEDERRREEHAWLVDGRKSAGAPPPGFVSVATLTRRVVRNRKVA